MKTMRWLVVLALLALLAPRAQGADRVAFRFAVSGDSRDCGDVVMPALSAKVVADHPAFYWHLGDFRKIYDFDADMQHQMEHRAKPLSIIEYEEQCWQDFIDNQLAGFGSVPVFLSIGNHEVIPPKTRHDYVATFADWLDAPTLRDQRLRDDPRDHQLHTYYHWQKGGVDFINLDNASHDQFDKAQMAWLEKVLARDAADTSVRTVVVGMHEALPESFARDHSMNSSEVGTVSGRQTYADLLRLRDQSHKQVYVISSHAHYYLQNAYNTLYWREHGGVLQGWIIGSAGAIRHPLPAEIAPGQGMTKVYGYLLADVMSSGEIRFTFKQVLESDIPQSVVERYTAEFVHWAFSENTGKPRGG